MSKGTKRMVHLTSCRTSFFSQLFIKMLDKDFNRPAKRCKITSFEIVIFFAFDMCSKPIFCLKRLLRKTKLARSCLNREMLLQTPKDT